MENETDKEPTVLKTKAVVENRVLDHELLRKLLKQQKRLIRKLAVTDQSAQTKRKDIWDVVSSLSGVFTFLSSIVIAALGVYFTNSYRKQDVHIAEAQTIEKFLPALNSPKPETTRGALLAIYALQNNELAARLASSYISSANLDACETILRNALGESKEQLTDSMLVAYRNRAFENLWDSKSTPESVEADFNRALQLRDEAYISKKWGAWYLANIYAGRGNIFREIRNYEKATADYKKALEIYPDYYWALMHIGVMYSDQKNYEQALEYIQKSIAISPNFGEPYVALAETLENLGRIDEAASNFDKAIMVEPNYFFSYFRRARFNLKRNLPDKAEKDFREIYEFSNDPTDRIRALQELKRLNPKYYETERTRNDNPVLER